MATKTINKARIQQRIDTTANWTTNDPVLLSGEMGIERLTDGTYKVKYGDGISKWSGLAYQYEFITMSEIRALVSQADTDADTAKTKANEASTSATNASTSETNAKTSETNAKTSETNAKNSETNAKASETNAAKSATSASDSATSASESANSAKTSADNAASINQQVIDNSYGLSVVDGCLNMTYEG